MWNEEGTESDVCCVAVTAKGNVVVFMWVTAEIDGERYTRKRRFLIFSSFEEAARDGAVNFAIRQAVKQRGVPVEEPDI